MTKPVYRLDEEQHARLLKTLARAETALNDWVHTYAPEMCDQEYVDATMERIAECGTLAYIGEVLVEVRAARKFLDG